MTSCLRTFVLCSLGLVSIWPCCELSLDAEIYYVDQAHLDASNMNPGTEALPWLTIQHAAEALSSGDTAYVKAGTYPEQVKPTVSGTSSQPIVISAYPGDTVVVDGSGLSLLEYEGLFQLEGVSHIEIVGFHAEHSRPFGTNTGIQVEGCSHVKIKNNVTYDTNSSGILVWGSDHVTVDGNEISLACNAGAASENECLTVGESHDFTVSNNYVHDGNAVRGEGIDTKDGSYNGLVFGNHVHDVQSVGIYVDAWDKHTHDINIFRNRVHDIDGDGFYIGSEQGGLLEDIRIFNNLSYRNQWVGLTIHDCCTDSHPIDDIEVINNTFYDNGTSSGWGGGILNQNNQATNIVFRNNIVSQNETFQIAEENGATTTVDYNLIDGFRGEVGETRGTDYQEGDPDFVDVAMDDFHLERTSIAIDQGSSLEAPSNDFDGAPRPQDEVWDIGAFEFVTLLFEDGFESGDMTAWDGSIP